MKEHPILFTTENLRLVAEGLKTMTRRVIKPQPTKVGAATIERSEWHGEAAWIQRDPLTAGTWNKGNPVRCPYGEPGHELWVRETLRLSSEDVYYDVDHVSVDDALLVEHADWIADYWPEGKTLVSAIHMPRWACRTRRPVESIAAERVQEITASDCLAEGIDLPEAKGCLPGDPPDGYHDWSEERKDEWLEGQARTIYFAQIADCDDHVEAFGKLWGSINAAPKPAKRNPYTLKREDCFVSYPWEAIRETRERRGLPWYVVGDPFVWAVGFGGKKA